MRIVVFGANGATGRLLTRQALAAGHPVAAVTRRPAGFPVTHARLSVAEAGVHDAQAAGRAVEGAGVALSALACHTPASRSTPTATASAILPLRCPGTRSTGWPW